MNRMNVRHTDHSIQIIKQLGVSFVLDGRRPIQYLSKKKKKSSPISQAYGITTFGVDNSLRHINRKHHFSDQRNCSAFPYFIYHVLLWALVFKKNRDTLEHVHGKRDGTDQKIKPSEIVKGLEMKSCEEWLEKWGVFMLKKRRLRGGKMSVFSYHVDDGVSLSFAILLGRA